jgi:hypothetical protein
MKNFTFVLIFLGICIFFSSCAPTYLTHLTPQQKHHTFTENGIEYTHLQQDSIEVIVGYYATEGEYLIMDVEVGNMTEDSVTFDPAVCSYMLIDSLSGNIMEFQKDGVSRPLISTAYNPEKELASIEQRIRQQEANLKAKRTFLTILAVAVTVATVAAVVNNNNSKSRDTKSPRLRAVNTNIALNLWSDSMRLIGTSAVDAHAQYSFKTDNLESLKETWQNMPLQKFVIPPKKRIRGDVIFHPEKVNGILKFIFPVANHNFEALFRQSVTKTP